MSSLRPQPLGTLLARALAEYDIDRAVFGLPRRSFWQGRAGLDLSVDVMGERVATPVGPAAGPHTQLAANLVVGWLAGARTLELKTIQVLDDLELPRPCIDAPDLGYNVEWSQELRLAESATEYATAWLLLHALAARGLVEAAAGPTAVSFEASVGYDLAGIRSDGVARFLDTMADASPLLAQLREGVPPALRPLVDVPVPPRIARTVTLSTFHGCPPSEIERIVEHLFTRHAMNVVVKFNPTLLGYDAVDALVRRRLGYTELALDRAAFDADLAFDDAVAMFARLEGAALRAGCRLGAKFTNTLVVKNGRGVLAGPSVYLSGAALHPLAVTLADRFAHATGGRFPLSFSGGVCAENFADTVAAGFAPVTTCTDLLRPTGYRRLPRYLKALCAAMEASGAASIDAFVRPGALGAYATRVADVPAYRAAQRTPPPPHAGALPFLDCAGCNNCVLVCPNGAFFSLPVGPVRVDGLTLSEDRQWAVFADLCNDCGNCTTFCAQDGAPQRVKPRFYGSRAAFDLDAPADGIVLEDGARRVTARLSGRTCTLVVEEGGERFADGAIEAVFDREHVLRRARRLSPADYAPTPWLARYHTLRLLRDAVVSDVNPASAALAADQR